MVQNSKGLRLWVLIYQSIGVVYGGLGTSPLYVYPNVFSSTPSPDDVLGTMSLIFWTLTIIVVLKYVSLVLHANDNGEGLHCLPSNMSLPFMLGSTVGYHSLSPSLSSGPAWL